MEVNTNTHKHNKYFKRIVILKHHDEFLFTKWMASEVELLEYVEKKNTKQILSVAFVTGLTKYGKNLEGRD